MSIRTAISELLTPSEPIKLELRDANLEQPSTSLASPAAFRLALGTAPTVSGEIVNERTALEITTVYCCVRVIAESIGNLPVKIRETLQKGSRIADDHTLAGLFTNAPNPDMSPAVFVETLAGNMALWGNGYAEIIRDRQGNVTELYPLNPAQIEVNRNTVTGLLQYDYTETTSVNSQTKRTILGKNMIHVPLFSGDGLKGLSPVQMARPELGLAMATQKHGSRYFANGSVPGGLLTPKVPITDPKQLQMFKDSWEAVNGGVNQGRIGVLPQEWAYQATASNLEDSQLIPVREFVRTQIAAIYRVPAHLVGDSTRQSNSNHEQASLSLIQDTLAPYLNKIEEEMQRKLLPPTGKVSSRFSIQFDITARLKTDLKTTIDTVNAGILSGVYSVNEGRQILGYNPIADGDAHYAPVNMIDLAKFAQWSPMDAKGPPSAPKVTETKSSHVPFQPLIRDAIGRLSTRQKPDSDTYQSLFGPSLQAICVQLIDEARSAMTLPTDWTPDTSKITTETLRSIEHRSGKWSPDHDATAIDETQRIYKALRINIFRDAGSALALQDAA